jgi:hypothetical protein
MPGRAAVLSEAGDSLAVEPLQNREGGHMAAYIVLFGLAYAFYIGVIMLLVIIAWFTASMLNYLDGRGRVHR